MTQERIHTYTEYALFETIQLHSNEWLLNAWASNSYGKRNKFKGEQPQMIKDLEGIPWKLIRDSLMRGLVGSQIAHHCALPAMPSS